MQRKYSRERKNMNTEDILLPKKSKKIIVYSTAPVKQVIGEVDVDGILSMKMTPMWELTKHGAGISRDKYRQYFKNSKCAFAYVLKKPRLFPSPKDLKDYAINQAPQSFVYIEEDKKMN